MSGLFPARVFPGFGPSILEAGSAPPSVYQVQGRRPSVLRQGVRQLCPRQPGVYGMLDEHGELIYVGKAKCLRTRLASYFRPRSRDPKAGRILRRTRVIAWELAPHEFSALVRELELIRRWRPRFNVQGQPGRRRWTYVCLGRRPAPYLFLSARPPANVLACFGPVSAGQRVRDAVRRVNDWLRLRDCPQAQEMVFTDQAELFPTLRAPGCLRYDIGTCLGPCAALCSRTAYGKQVRSARSFLEGTDDSLLQSLERAMKEASAALEFERAAGLRDQLASVRWLHQQLD
ncbi:MAG: UvrB/UvrC motif-containing protein, partial [Planctomycetes bacterium]|nr:UvrB/UvrC motif-containing protein [Planctomycetota bacterium]